MASKRRLRRKSCERKIRYIMENVASKVIHHMRQRGQIDGYLQIYKCGFCNGFHIGHPSHK